MRYRKLTEDGDYSFGNGQLDIYKDTPEGVGQSVRTRILLWANEWFLNTDDGTPFVQGIIGKYAKELADSTLQDRITDTPKVTSIENYVSTLDPENRKFSVEVEINTIYGPTVVQVNNYANY